MAFIVVATTNAHKVAEYRRLLAGQEVELQSLLDFPGCPPIEETGDTFAANAAIKAAAASRYCEVPAFADDSGLEVEALNGAPGIYSSRYAATDAERIARVLKELEGVENRRARFVCAIAIAANGEVIETFEGEVRGVIAAAPAGENGFGYDPIFCYDGSEKTNGELTADKKNAISHRGKAFRSIAAYLLRTRTP